MLGSIKFLCASHVCDEDSIEPFFCRVRDREDISVLRCRKSGVIFLSRSDHMAMKHYEQKNDLKYWGGEKREDSLSNTSEDDQRRCEQFRDMIKGKIWLDVGTGLGGILDRLSSIAAKTIAVEPQSGAKTCLESLGYKVYSSVKDVQEKDIEVVTLFHVLEHMIDPVEELTLIREHMISGGEIIIEVPHARDALLSTYDCKAFKDFTLWSEHLILHTRQSLQVFLSQAGFSCISIRGFQRYPLANHLYWLSHGKPGGHSIWKQFSDPELIRVYAEVLSKSDSTDTLIATAKA